MELARINAAQPLGLRNASVPAQTRAASQFAYVSNEYRVLFGFGVSVQLRAEVDRLGIRRALVLTTPGRRDEGTRLRSILGDRFAALFDGARMHTPVDITEAALEIVETHDIDGLVAIGGGSTIGLCKALSLRTGLSQLVMPTTYAGSEMTPILGETRHGIKTTQQSSELIPDTIIYDVDLTRNLPSQISAASGLNAIAHAAEALYAQGANPLTSLMAEHGIAALSRALPRIMVTPADLDARYDALYGAWLCGACLGTVGMALHHKLCHAIGGSFGLPHAQTHAIILPHAMRYNAASAPEAMATISRAVGSLDAADGLFDLARRLGLPRSLGEIGMPESGIDRAADIAVQSPYPNPRRLDRVAIRDLIAAAHRGDPPGDRYK